MRLLSSKTRLLVLTIILFCVSPVVHAQLGASPSDPVQSPNQSGPTPTPLDDTDPGTTPTPFDGGVSILIVAGVGLGVKKIRENRKKKSEIA